jgi:ParB/RepB/Spo0J family partition protein
MKVQMALFQDDTKKKAIITVPVESLKLSQYNPRFSRSQDDIERLAQRIARNGFEITRALWAYRNCDGYEVFAGGTRLEAARAAGVSELPIVLHDGFTDEEIVRLAEVDNENDEYHIAVNPVDEWAHYAWLSEQGWTQEQIAAAKGVAKSLVSERIKWNGLPDEVKRYVLTEDLTEGHIREITSVVLTLELHQWLTNEAAWIDLANKAVHDKSKNGSKTVKELMRQGSLEEGHLAETSAICVNAYFQDWLPTEPA